MSYKNYQDVAYHTSQYITQKYSTSFSLGIKLLAGELHKPIYAIYGYVRLADEIVDTFHDQDKAMILAEFQLETERAMERKFSIHPALHAFQEVVYQYQIPYDLVEAFLLSMKMDLEATQYNQEKFAQYIYGSAEVVGLMCLHIFVNGDKEKVAALSSYAKSLGSAFQKVNFLRDLKDDYEERGRFYFPEIDFGDFGETGKSRIIEDIEKDFAQGLEGIRKLPVKSRMGVYLAYRYYYKLFRKIASLDASHLKKERVRINNGSKLYIMLQSYARHSMNIL